MLFNHKSKSKWFTIIGVILILFLVAGCSASKSNSGTVKLESDVALTQQLEAEKGIEKVMVQVEEGKQPAVNVDIEINDEQELSAEEVINKYSAVIKEKYPDRTIDMIVAKEGKLLKQVTLK